VSDADKIRTPEKRAKFLAALADTCNVRRACELSDLPRSTAYDWREEDDVFRAQWEKALKIGADALEEEAIRRAREGWDEPVFYKGDEVAIVRKYSDTLLIFLLKGAKPEKYSERVKNEITGADGSPLAVKVEFVNGQS
jgi:hypothetical protein